MLLPAHADGGDFPGGGAGVFEGVANGGGRGVTPGVGMLLLGAGGQAGDQIIGAGGFADDGAVAGVDDQDFGGLSATIDAEN